MLNVVKYIYLYRLVYLEEEIWQNKSVVAVHLDYIIQIKIERAKDILSNSSHSIRRVAELLGYTDSNYFVKLFKMLPKVDAGLAASIFHFNEVTISELKKILANNEIPVRI